MTQKPRDISAINFLEHGTVRKAPELPVGTIVVDAAGEIVAPIDAYLQQLFANDSSLETIRSYALALLRWWRFLAAVDVSWERATAGEHVDFVIWMKTTTPRHGGKPGSLRKSAGNGFAPRTINHSNAVISGFYEFHARRGTGPIINPVRAPFPRPNAHHNPMQQFTPHRRRTVQQKVPQAVPKSIPDEVFDWLFARLKHDRDRALVAFYVSSGARASELLGLTGDALDQGNSRIRVQRKGTRAEQWIPASPDSFVWLRRYLGQRPLNPDSSVWLTIRKPYRQLKYPAIRQVFIRAQLELGSGHTLHALRHTAGYRMAQDPNLSITDVSWVLGHQWLSTTQIYTQPHPEEVLERMAQHFERPKTTPAPPPSSMGYDKASLDTLFGFNDER